MNLNDVPAASLHMVQPVRQQHTHKLMLAEAFMLGQISGGDPAGPLASQPGVVKRLSLYCDEINSLATLGLDFEPILKLI